MAIIKASEVTRRTGMPRSSIYEHAAQGTFTKPVKIGAHASGWPDYEVDAITSARIAGWSNDQVRSLVRALHAQRKTAADGLLITPLVGENAFTKPNKGFPKKSPTTQIESTGLKPVAANEEQEAAASATPPPNAELTRSRKPAQATGAV